MKKSDELKVQKTEKMRALNAILDKAEGENKRALTADIVTGKQIGRAHV